MAYYEAQAYAYAAWAYLGFAPEGSDATVHAKWALEPGKELMVASTYESHGVFFRIHGPDLLSVSHATGPADRYVELKLQIESDLMRGVMWCKRVAGRHVFVKVGSTTLAFTRDGPHDNLQIFNFPLNSEGNIHEVCDTTKLQALLADLPKIDPDSQVSAGLRR
jgi:hypothetical protein